MKLKIIHLSENDDVSDSWHINILVFINSLIIFYKYYTSIYLIKSNVSITDICGFSKKDLQIPSVPVDSMFSLYRFDNYLLPANNVITIINNSNNNKLNGITTKINEKYTSLQLQIQLQAPLLLVVLY